VSALYWAEHDWTFWIALVAGVLSAASIVLHIVAPRTKATWDDALCDDIDEQPAKATPKPPLPPVAVLALVVLGAMLLSGASACTPAQRTASPHAVVDCTGANGAAIGAAASSMASAQADGGCVTPEGKTDWSCVEVKAILVGVAIGGCAFVKVVSASSPPPGAAALIDDNGPARATLEDYRSHYAGGATFHTAQGDL
jgi:hypothetical protein